MLGWILRYPGTYGASVPRGIGFQFRATRQIPAPEGDERPARSDTRPLEAIEDENTTASWDTSEIASASKTTNEIAAATEEAEIVTGDTTVNAQIRG